MKIVSLPNVPGAMQGTEDMTIKVYGLKNCDATRKAVKILQESGSPAQIHDLRLDGLPPNLLREWIKELGWETMLNKRGTTWRGLPEEMKGGMDEKKAEMLMSDHPALIKRPIINRDGKGFTVGLKGLK